MIFLIIIIIIIIIIVIVIIIRVITIIISLIVKQQITGQTGNSGTNDVEIMAQLKYLSNFWRNFQIPLINWEKNLQLKWPEKTNFSRCNCNKSSTRI